MTEHAVVVVGGGPTGLVLAGELALAGVDVAVVERRPTQELAGSRAGGLHARTIEMLDQRGIAGRFVAAGQPTTTVGFAQTPLEIGDFPTRHPYTLGLWQNQIERLLAEWVGSLAVTFHRGRDAVGLVDEGDRVSVELDDGETLRASYVVGCDGGRSIVRKAAGIGFPGWEPTTSALIGEVEVTEEPELGVRRTATGVHALGRLDYEIREGEIVYADHGPVTVMVTEEEVGATEEPTMDQLRTELVRVFGSHFGAHSPLWLSRFTDASRQAATYRLGRVLLAGDAAHVHSPVGGQGLNTGVQDALNLGWKLGLVVRGLAPDTLLDSYHAERHPVGARVLQGTMAQVALIRPGDDRLAALRSTVADLLGDDGSRRRYAGMMSGLDIRYDLGEGHPLLGRRMPDLDLTVAGTDGPVRVFSFLHDARPVLLDLGGPGVVSVAGWADRVPVVAASYDGPWELPVLGEVPAPAAVLVRPDGYVAWVGDGTDAGLAEALARSFGPGTRSTTASP
ncbi:MAG: FAD-dependent monooxygenase [Nocardioidaceae bacterium]